MSYRVAGTNIFGQWLSEENIFPVFQKINLNEDNLKLSYSRIRLVQVNWSYNILKVDQSFYISGSWCGEGKQFVKLDLPQPCISKGTYEMDVVVAGNDYKLLIVSKKMRSVWVLNLENLEDIKEFEITSDIPAHTEPGNVLKKLRKQIVIVKVMANNSTYLFLSSEGHVFIGLPPTELDTRHCDGKIIDIKCGYEHCMLLTDKGKVYSWGNGRRLQLGHGDLNVLDSPALIEALDGIKIVKVTAGGWHSLALSEFGDLYVWGWNDSGQLGIKSQSAKSHSIPTLVDFFDDNNKEITLNVKDIECGSKHSAVILEDGSLWTTGCNKYGQLGLPPKTFPVVNIFKQIYHCSKNSKLRCGPWSTIVIDNWDQP